ncbi:MAG: carboxypeptidase regulatory-like domain-containing protein, partial [Planctomycetes bacterium]|nr:carboxypeptidase regulatory-like domain-containing protein [Planctomycetota bacterium]
MTSVIKVLVVVAVLAGILLLLRFLPQDAALPDVPEPTAEATAGAALPEAGASAPVEERAVPAAAPAPEPARPGPESGPAVRGSVWSQHGAPIAGATVRAYDPLVNREALVVPLAETRTDSSGAFAFADEGRGRSSLLLEASAPGFYSARAACPVGEQVHFQLGKPGALVGRVTQGDAPVADARIQVRSCEGAGLPQSCRTDADGRYRLDRLRPGLHWLCLSREDYGRIQIEAGEETRVDLAVEAQEFVNATGLVTTTTDAKPIPDVEVVLAAGILERTVRTDAAGQFRFERVPAKHRLHVQPPRLCIGDVAYRHTGMPSRESSGSERRYRIEYEPGVLIRGTVLGPDAVPVAGARVAVVTSIGCFYPTAETTDDQGRFELIGHFDEAGDAAVQIMVLEEGHNPRGLFTRQMKLAPGERLDDLVLQLERGGTVSGRIREEAGGPAACAWVGLRSVGTESKSYHGARAGQDGGYCMENVPAGRYTLSASMCGRPSYQSAEVVEVRAGARIDGRDVTLPAGAVLAGRVEDSEGRPLVEAEVQARPVTPAAERPRPSWIRARLEPGGRFRLDGLAQGTYCLEGSAPGYETQEQTASAGDCDLVLRLQRPPRVTGRVLILPGGAPATAFRLSLLKSGELRPSAFQFLDAAGRFSLPGLEEGDYELEASVAKDGGLFLGRTSFHMPAGTSPPFQEVRVERTRSVHGLVQDPDGLPVPDARIVLLLEGRSLEDPLHATETDRRGRYAFPEISPGAYLVRAAHPEWVETSRPVFVGSGPIAPVDLVLERTG